MKFFIITKEFLTLALLVTTVTDALAVQIVMDARLAMIDVYKCAFLVITVLVAIAVRLIVLVAMVAVLVVAIVAVLAAVQAVQLDVVAVVAIDVQTVMDAIITPVHLVIIVV